MTKSPQKKKVSVDKVSKGLNALVDEFTSAVKEMVNAGEDTVIHLAVGSGRVISAVVDTTGQVTKIGIETAGEVTKSVGGGVARAGKGLAGTTTEVVGGAIDLASGAVGDVARSAGFFDKRKPAAKSVKSRESTLPDDKEGEE